MDITKIQRIREEMGRAEARKLQPHFIGSFFIEAFQHLGGVIRQREPKRYQISNVPAIIRTDKLHNDNRDRQIGTREAILTRYERICFDKELISVPGKPLAAFICPGHPLVPISKEITEGDDANVYYLRQPFQKEPDFGVTSVNYNLKELKQRSQKPW